MNNIEIWKNLIYTFWKTWFREDEEDFYEKQRQDKNSVNFCIYLEEEKKVIWNIDLTKIDKISRNSEFWVVIFDEKYLSKWYWTEAVKLLLKYAFEIIGLHKVYGRFVSFNKRWEKAYEKAGFKKVWVLKQQEYIMWEYYDQVLIEIFRDEYLKNKSL